MSIRRAFAPVIVMLFLAAACAGDDTSETTATSSTTTVLAPETTAAAQSETTVVTAETTAAMSETTTASTEASPPSTVINTTGELAHVVLVEPNDVLNIRYGPGVTFDIAGTFGPTARDLHLTDVTDVVNNTPWVFIDQHGWVSAFFLTTAIDPAAAEANPRTMAVVDDLFDSMAAKADLRGPVGWRGLFVAHFDPVRRFKADQLAGLMSDSTKLEWGSQGCSPEECLDLTFAEAVGDSFIGAWGDADRIVTFDEKIPGPGGLGDAGIIPQEFANYHYVAVHDPGDDPAFDGLDWVTWYVYLDYSDGDPVVVGMSIDSWGP